MTARLLVLDTATDTVHLGVADGERVLVRALPGGAAASAALLPAIQALLDEAGLTLRALDAIAFGRGPGAFTGLRTACSIAQGLAVGADRPLIGVDTLAAVAAHAEAAGAGPDVWAVTDARMGEVYAARWRLDDTAGWTVVDDAGLYAPGDFLARFASSPAARAGNAWSLVPALAASFSVVSDPAWPLASPDGVSLLRLARQAWARGERLDPALALPRYVRNKVAQTTEERAAVAQARAESRP